MPSLAAGDVVVVICGSTELAEVNLSIHKWVRVQRIVESAAAWVVYLPPCSPDLNPTALALANLK